AAVQLGRKDLARARRMAQEAVGEDPEYVPGYLRLADIALASDDWESALEAVESAARIAPDDEAIARKRIGMLQRVGRRSEAIRHLKTLVETETGRTQASLLLLLADLLCQEGDVVGFERSILDASRLEPTTPAVFRLRVRCLGRLKRFDEIVKLIAERQSEHPSDSESLALAARVLMSAGAERYFKEARSVFDGMLASDPLSANLGLGELGYQTEDFTAAREAYQNVLGLDAKHEQALNDLAWILALELGDLDEAIRLADQGIKLYGQNPHLLDTRGVVLWKLGRLDEAVRDLQKSASIAARLRRWRTQVEALIHLAEVYVDRKELIQARLVLEEADALDARQAILPEAERDELDQLLDELRPAE
ncbi:MAG: tetratricopeptide repeat protein, partial [Planctomycetes bacterium]|nr:tetratricopeptide repeat protein [Planctomycetota bacterium]